MTTFTMHGEHILQRTRLLNDILEMNPGSDLGFLSEFSDDELDDYRSHLLHAQLPRSQARAWSNENRSRAISFRDSDL